MFKKIAYFLSFFLLALSWQEKESQAKLFDAKEFTLNNGLQVVVLENARAPIVTLMMWYKVGSMDEEPGKSGLAHVTEHMMFKGKSGSASNELFGIVEKNGGISNAGTSKDFTVYYESFAKEHLEKMIKLEAERMQTLDVTQEMLTPELDVVMEEFRMRVDNNPVEQFFQALNSSLFWNHPYGRPVIGWEHEIKKLAIQDVLDFHKKWYAPNNAIVVVAGDVKVEDVKKLMVKHFSGVDARPVQKRVNYIEPKHKNQTRVTLTLENVTLPYFARSYYAPNFKDAKNDEHYALQILSHILGDGSTSLLYRRFVEDLKLASSVSVDYKDYSRDSRTFSFVFQAGQGHTLAEIEKAFDDQMASLIKEGVSDQMITDAKTRMLADIDYLKDSSTGGGRGLGAVMIAGETLEGIETWPDHIKAVTKEQVNAALRQVLDTRTYVNAELHPEKKDSK